MQKPKKFSKADVFFAVAGMGALLSGCGSATTSPVQSPQLQTPTLYNPNDGRGGFSSASGGLNGGASNSKKGSGVLTAEEAAYAPLETVQTPLDTFLTSPYVQKGDASASRGGTDSLAFLWHTKATTASEGQIWTVETHKLAPGSDGRWVRTDASPTHRPFKGSGETPDQSVWRANVTNLLPGALFDYRISLNGKPVFAGRTRAPRAPGTPFRVVLWGDGGVNTNAQKKIAVQASLAQPDFVCLTGNPVFNAGRADEYERKFFPIYNSESSGPDNGAPLMRSTLFFAAVGERDTRGLDLSANPDGLAYFAYFGQPLNGPETTGNTPELSGGAQAEKIFKTDSAAAQTFPRMANYSFDYGSSHWTVLDSNAYADWSGEALRSWLTRDLASAQKASWRFVVFNHPPFASVKEGTAAAQQMRVISDLLERYKVSVVWSGNVHNYQRTFPLTFKPDAEAKKGATIPGTWTLDKLYNGDKQTRPKGVIYVTDGAGGASMVGKDLEAAPSSWEPFTRKLVASTHSFTQMDVSPQTVTVRQISEDGKELDKWVISQ